MDSLEPIKRKIYEIRGQKVMLDSDLAILYGVLNKRLNEQVKRNIERFPDDFMFQLTKEEWNALRSQIATLEDLKSQNVTSNFSGKQQEEVLKSQIATSKVAEDKSVNNLRSQIATTKNLSKIRTYVSDLVRSAKQRIVLIDNFVDDRVLSLMDKRANIVEATIHSRYYESFQTDLKKHNEQYREIIFIQLPHRNHDRFLIIDDDVYLLGASVKDMGVGLCAVTKMEVSPEMVLGLLK